jgi:PAS domain S-box-containing protein
MTPRTPSSADDAARYRCIIDAVTECAIVMLDPKGFVTTWNPGAQRITGHAGIDIVGQHFSRLHGDGGEPAGDRALHEAAATGHHESEGWRVRKDGARYWAAAAIDAIRDENGELAGFVEVARDLTEHREAQETMQKAQQQLAYAQKMEALGQLTGGVAHDFNNLLMIVVGHLATVRRLVGDDPKGLRAIEAIELASRRGATLTRQLLAFSRRQRLVPVSVALPACIETCRSMLVSAAGGAVKLVIDIPADTWPISVDVSELELALVNLVVNARDAMAQGGTVTIRAANVRGVGPEPALQGDFVAIAVDDVGTGIPVTVLPRIFEPFFTTKDASKGTGLGLSQVHGFAHQSGGTVVAESEEGRGATLTLYLPRAHQRPVPPDAARTPRAEPQASGRVLVVEDNAEVAEASSSVLREIGYEVLVVTDTVSAESALDKGRPFDLVFSDLVMAGRMDGLELARSIRERRPELPVLLTTGYSNAAETVAGEFPILRKPYQIDDLGRAVAGLITSSRR